MRLHLLTSARNAALALCLSASAVTAQAAPSLAEIRAWAARASTMQANFQQYNQDGTIDTGMLYLKKPGKLRMDFDRGSLLLAENGVVTLFAAPYDLNPQRLHLDTTPSWHLIRPEAKLDQPGSLKTYTPYYDISRITAHDPDNPQAGRIVLEFLNYDRGIHSSDYDARLIFYGWKVRSRTGELVTVRLGDQREGVTLSDGLFSAQEEYSRRHQLRAALQ